MLYAGQDVTCQLDKYACVGQQILRYLLNSLSADTDTGPLEG